MIGLLRGPMPDEFPSLISIRRESVAAERTTTWFSPGSVLVKAAVKALKEAGSVEELAIRVPSYVSAPAEVGPVEATISVAVGIGSAFDQAAAGLRNSIRVERTAAGAHFVVRWITAEDLPAFARHVLAALRTAGLPAEVPPHLPTPERLAAAPKASIDGLLYEVDSIRGPNGQRIGQEILAAVRAAAAALCPPQSPDAKFLFAISAPLGPDPVERDVVAAWVLKGQTETALASRDPGALMQMRKESLAREVDRELQASMTHDCLPERAMSTVRRGGSFLHDGDDEELALEFLFASCRLLEQQEESSRDRFRVLRSEEVTVLLARLRELSALEPTALQSIVSKWNEEDGNPDDYSEVAATALKHSVAGPLVKFIETAIAKGSPLTLVSCNDWKGGP